MAYADADDLIARFDSRTIGDLASDSGEPVEEANFGTDAKIAAALSSASGEINSAVQQAGLYSTTELAALTGDDAEFLKQLTCDLAMGRLLMRRPGKYDPDTYARLIESAHERLDAIRRGINLFNIEEKKSAGQPSIDGPTAVDYVRLNMIPERAKGYYPARSTRLPIGRG